MIHREFLMFISSLPKNPHMFMIIKKWIKNVIYRTNQIGNNSPYLSDHTLLADRDRNKYEYKGSVLKLSSYTLKYVQIALW